MFQHGFDAFGYRYVRGGVVLSRLHSCSLCVRCSPNAQSPRRAAQRSVWSARHANMQQMHVV